MINRRRKLERVKEGKERDRRRDKDKETDGEINRMKSGGKIEQVKCRMVKSNGNKNGRVMS